MTESKITPEIVEQHNLTSEEYTRIVQILGREPNMTELGVFSVMWSEHCSYKSSRVHLKRLPTTGPLVIVPPGENAGVVDVGDDWCIAFKVESHNHPSFIEPFQGAGNRCRRNSTGCVYDGGSPSSGDEFASFRTAG
jgi:phosphoribosylformylglycinamidine synthase